MKKTAVLLAVVMLSACAIYKPTAAGRAVRIVENKPAGCKELGKIEVKSVIRSDKEEDGRDKLLNTVVKKGGNTVRIAECKRAGYSTFGLNTAYEFYYTAYAYNCPYGGTN